jgi:hypothetical protein
VLFPSWGLWGHRIDDPIWLGSPIWEIDQPAAARCTDCQIASRVVGDISWDTRKECPMCFAPGYIINEEFVVIDAGGKVWRTKS